MGTFEALLGEHTRQKTFDQFQPFVSSYRVTWKSISGAVFSPLITPAVNQLVKIAGHC